MMGIDVTIRLVFPILLFLCTYIKSFRQGVRVINLMPGVALCPILILDDIGYTDNYTTTTFYFGERSLLYDYQLMHQRLTRSKQYRRYFCLGTSRS
nr:hypothetical protein [Tanacetum cinerariifolium]